MSNLINRNDEMTGLGLDLSRSVSVSLSWANPEVKAARSARYGVVVAGQQFDSVAKAFAAMGVPASKIIPLRAKLRDNGAVMYGELTFFKAA